ncbi:hypothetical protein IGI52_000435 [Enterococcus sp. DIV0187]
MQANLGKTWVPFSIDLITDDSIVPKVTKHNHKLMFGDKSVEIYAYPTEQIIADKLHAAVHFGLVNSRSKDFYDLYTMSHVEEVDNKKTVSKCEKIRLIERGYPIVLKRIIIKDLK